MKKAGLDKDDDDDTSSKCDSINSRNALRTNALNLGTKEEGASCRSVTS